MERRAIHEAAHCFACELFGLPIISVAIDGERPRLHRGRCRAPLESIVTMCLSGPAAESYLCGPAFDDSDRTDIAMARRYLADRFDSLLTIEHELQRARDAADRLVRTPAAVCRITLIAYALLRNGRLTADQLREL
jgi:hypothetical protein